jgi:hypothetical protein
VAVAVAVASGAAGGVVELGSGVVTVSTGEG